jgi:hypothetical protein
MLRHKGQAPLQIPKLFRYWNVFVTGQAATEMAIFGVLIIAAFTFIIMFSERINRQQAYIMQSFRESLKESRALKSPVSYTKIAHRRMPNISSPMNLGGMETFSADSNVVWGDRLFGLPDDLSGVGGVEPPESHTFYKLNDAEKIEVIPPLYTVVAGDGDTDANIRFSVTDGVITGYTIVAGGSGYTMAPTITIKGGGGTGATAEAVITDGVVTSVNITNGGSGYTAAPMGTVEETSTTEQTTHVVTYQDLVKSSGKDTVSTRSLTAKNVLTETSPDYDLTFYLGPDGKYYVDTDSKLERTRTMEGE